VSDSPPRPTLLVVHHTTSPSLEAMLDAALDGTRAEGVEGVDVSVRAALAATAYDLLHADAVLLGTPANIGYMSGALKHFFDQVYYPCQKAKAGCPYALYVHGNLDVTGAQRAVHAIATGMGWQQTAADVVVQGEPSRQDLQACWELGAVLAAGLMADG
jgi:multimeric flavodoxin WrbA